MGFVESMNGLTIKIFHELLHDPSTINNPLSKESEILTND